MTTTTATESSTEQRRRLWFLLPIVVGATASLSMIVLVAFATSRGLHVESFLNRDATATNGARRLPARDRRRLRRPELDFERRLWWSPETRIIGGSEVTKGRYSYTVSIQTADSGHFCGGSLISKDVVLTAAHCYYQYIAGKMDDVVVVVRLRWQGVEFFTPKIFTHSHYLNSKFELKRSLPLLFSCLTLSFSYFLSFFVKYILFNIQIGKHNLSDPTSPSSSTPSVRTTVASEAIPLRTVKIHPSYASGPDSHDFAILFLQRPTVVKNIPTVALNKNAAQPGGGSTVAVLGWGDVDDDPDVRQFSDSLQRAALKVVDNAECERVSGWVGDLRVSFEGYIDQSMLCAQHRSRDACQGDSGACRDVVLCVLVLVCRIVRSWNGILKHSLTPQYVLHNSLPLSQEDPS
ncbi:hypothetical protein ACHAXS_009160 [Conticribra weissflogii]